MAVNVGSIDCPNGWLRVSHAQPITPGQFAALELKVTSRHTALQDMWRGRRLEFGCVVRNGSFTSVWPDDGDFRIIPVNGHSQGRLACLKGASFGHEAAGAVSVEDEI